MSELRNTLTAVLRGEAIDWSAYSLDSKQLDLVAEARHEGVGSLLGSALREMQGGVPSNLLVELGQLVRQDALRERRYEIELMAILKELESVDIPALLLKGTPLAYTHYAQAWLRPRCDVDLLVAMRDVERTKSLLLEMGYAGPRELSGPTLSNELTFIRRHKGARHVDLHWKTSSRPIFSSVLSFNALVAASVPIASLHPTARSPNPVHSLLIACMHRVQHDNSGRLLWLYDIHLIVGRLSDTEAREFIDIARSRRVWTVCARSVQIAAAHFHTWLPEPLLAGLDLLETERLSEPSAIYLSHRPWRARVTDLQSLRSWRDRLNGFRQLTLPRSDYIRQLYADRPSTPLPLLYLDRLGRRAVVMSQAHS